MYEFKTAKGHVCKLADDSECITRSIFASFNKIHMYFRTWHEGKHMELGRFILRHKLKPGDQVDHIDRDPSNNTTRNLRIVTKAQNMSNRGKTRANTSGFIGVYKTCPSQLRRGCKPWYSKIMHNKKTTHIGNFNTAEEASDAYDLKCLFLKGEYAVLNNAKLQSKRLT